MGSDNFVFDLDGTLIDSAPSVLSSIQTAFEALGLKPVKALNSDILGPPLARAIYGLLAEPDRSALPKVVEEFKRHYDEVGYLETKAYDNIPEILQILKSSGLSLHIATNKRYIPARKIVNLLRWDTLFTGIYSLDYFNPALSNKAELLKRISTELALSNSAISFYVGDRSDDLIAAQEAEIRFCLAGWGYGMRDHFCKATLRVAMPTDLKVLLKFLR
jgi:phosphoglycolate phosphatase